jgi:competence protein ComGF
MAESGHVEVAHYVSTLDVQRYHRLNIREVGEKLSREIIRTQTFLDNPIPVKMNTLDFNSTMNNSKVEEYRNAYRKGVEIMVNEISHNYIEIKESRRIGVVSRESNESFGQYKGSYQAK